MTEPPPRSRAIAFVQVLVAAVFLAVIGGAVGLALGLRDRDSGAVGTGGTVDGGGAVGTGGTVDGGGAVGTGGTVDTGGTSRPSHAPSCPDEVARQAGQAALTQVLYVQTGFSEVWICRDGGGTLYYQGHRFTPDDRLFLTGVRREADEYLATNGETVYRVSRDELVIENADGDVQERQPAINSGG